MYFENYSGSLGVRAKHVLRPTAMAELVRAISEHDTEAGGAITVRSAGNSLHNQALGKDCVLLLDCLPHTIAVTVDDDLGGAGSAGSRRWNTVEVSGWTPWDCIVRAALGLGAPQGWGQGWFVARGRGEPPAPTYQNVAWLRSARPGPRPLLVPYVFVSSGRITPAGSLSGDGVWRMSAVYGRESDGVLWLDVLLSDARLVRLYNPRWSLYGDTSESALTVAPTRAENDVWFSAVVGGFGLLGVIVKVKYALLELAEDVHVSDLVRKAGAPCEGSERTDGAPLQRLLDQAENLADRVLERTVFPRWPRQPHSSANELGGLGAQLAIQAITWLQPTRDLDEIADSLARHWWEQELGRAGRDEPLPARSCAGCTASFALLFPNQRKPQHSVLGRLAFAEPVPGLPGFKLWDRRYAWLSTSRLLRYALLPWVARVGEQIVYRAVFERCIQGGLASDPIPECGFFLEGHAIALAARWLKPQTLQQAWTVPFAVDEEGRCVRGKRELAYCLERIRAISQRRFWRRNAVRIQICDIKCVPPSTAMLGSSPDGPSFMVTITVENARGYKWPWSGKGSPQEALQELATELDAVGARPHLTKALYVEPGELARAYGDACSVFRLVKRTLDARGAWSSELAQQLGI